MRLLLTFLLPTQPGMHCNCVRYGEGTRCSVAAGRSADAKCMKVLQQSIVLLLRGHMEG